MLKDKIRFLLNTSRQKNEALPYSVPETSIVLMLIKGHK